MGKLNIFPLRWYLVLIWGIFFSISATAQQHNVKIQIVNSSHQPICFANISLLNAKDSATIAYGFADSSGKYIFKNISKGEYILFANEMAHQSKYMAINVDAKDLMVSMQLSPSVGKKLDEVIVQSEKPIIINGDTTSYNVKSFLRGNERNVEELLKRLPGVTVESDGIVKFKGVAVEKVMVEGDDFFEKGYRLLTKNMPAKPIEKVDAIDNYTSNKLLSGFEKTKKVALNLKLSDDAKRNWFGNMYGAGELEKLKNYQLGANLMNFGKKTKYYLLGTGNNIGEDATGQQEFTPIASSDYLIGSDENTNSLMRFNQSNSQIDTKRSNFNNAKLLSLNAIFNPSKKLKIKPLLFLNWDTKRYYQNTIDSFIVPGQTFTNYTDLTFKKKSLQAMGKLEIEYTKSTHENIRFIFNYNNFNVNDYSNNVFNNVPIVEHLKSPSSKLSSQMVYTNKLSKNDVLIASLNYTHQDAPQDYNTNSYLLNEILTYSVSSSNTFQNIKNDMQYGGFAFSFLHKSANGNLFKSSIGGNFRKDIVSSNIGLDAGVVVQDSAYNNGLHYQNNNLYWKNQYAFSFGKFKWKLNSDFQYFHLDVQNGNSTNKNWLRWNPNTSLNMELNPKNNLSLNYGYSTNNMDARQALNNYYLTNYRGFQRGMNSPQNLNVYDNSTIGINYNYGRILDDLFAFLLVNYAHYNNYQTSYASITQDFSMQSDTILKGKTTFQVVSNLNYYVSKLSSRFQTKIQYSLSSYQDFVNGLQPRKINSNTVVLGEEISSIISNHFNMQTGVNWMKTKFTIKNVNAYSNDNYKYYMYAFYKLNTHIDFQLKGDGYYFGGVSGKKDYYFVDFIGRYNIVPNKWTVSMNTLNIFNTHRFLSYNLTDTYRSIQYFQLLPRMMMLRLEYQF